MTHPNSVDLEAFACGETNARVAAHLVECGACAAFVAELRDLVAAGPSAKEADAAVERARALDVMPQMRAYDDVAVHNRQTRDAKRRLWRIVIPMVTPLVAAAAAALLFVRSVPSSPDLDMPVKTSAEPATALEPDDIRPRTTTETRFKGGAQIAVIRERGTEQARFTSTVPVRPGDRLRVEVAIDGERAIVGGVLADDGSYLELMTEGVRGPGTHLSERSAKIDAAPTRGIILVGTPEAVARARASRVMSGVGSLRVESEVTP